MTKENQNAEEKKATTSSRRRGSPYRRRRNRSGNRNRRKNKFVKTGIKNKSDFSGRETDLKSHIYDCTTSRQALDGFVKTTEEVSLYVGRKYKTGPYIRPALTKLSRPNAIGSRPKAPKNEDGSDSMDIVDAAIFKEDVKAYSMLRRQYNTDLR